MVIAWRINRLMRRRRTLPQLPANLLLEKEKWQATYILNEKKAPALNMVVRMTAKLGGFPDKKGDGEPGVRML